MKEKILFVDRFLKGKPHAYRKEGFELFAAAKKLGYLCDIAGKNCDISENQIPEIAGNYSLIVVSENYPRAHDPWEWWDWESIKTRKCFWAIDTHLVNYKKWIKQSKFDYVAFNNKKHIFCLKGVKTFWLPYGVSAEVYSQSKFENLPKVNDVVFIGGLTKKRKKIIEKYSIKHIEAFGDEYIKAMKSAKICFNLSISDDINAKYFEILASGSFMLTNFNRTFSSLFEKNLITKMMFKKENEIPKKIKYYLKNEKERIMIATQLKNEVLTNHTYEARLTQMLNEISEKGNYE